MQRTVLTLVLVLISASSMAIRALAFASILFCSKSTSSSIMSGPSSLPVCARGVSGRRRARQVQAAAQRPACLQASVAAWKQKVQEAECQGPANRGQSGLHPTNLGHDHDGTLGGDYLCTCREEAGEGGAGWWLLCPQWEEPIVGPDPHTQLTLTSAAPDERSSLGGRGPCAQAVGAHVEHHCCQAACKARTPGSHRESDW